MRNNFLFSFHIHILDSIYCHGARYPDITKFDSECLTCVTGAYNFFTQTPKLGCVKIFVKINHCYRFSIFYNLQQFPNVQQIHDYVLQGYFLKANF